jgi:divalent metal cation (Fe/Co/Zn/Cd) transporter
MAVLLGLPWLAAALGSLFTATVGWLAVYVTKKVAIAIAVVAALGVLTGAFVLAIEGAASAFSYTFPIAANVGFLVPPDLPTLIAAYTAIRIVYWVYKWNIKIVQLRLF